MAQEFEDLSWTPDKDKLTEMIDIEGTEYQAWVVKRAAALVARHEGCTLDLALAVVMAGIEVEKEAYYSGSTGPNHAIVDNHGSSTR